MGLKSFFSNWSKRSDASTLERAEEEAHMSDTERRLDAEDYEAKKDDVFLRDRAYGGFGAERTAEDDLNSL